MKPHDSVAMIFFRSCMLPTTICRDVAVRGNEEVCPPLAACSSGSVAPVGTGAATLARNCERWQRFATLVMVNPSRRVA